MDEPVQFPFKGNVEELRVVMEELATLHPNGWEACPGERLRWEEIRKKKTELVGIVKQTLTTTGAASPPTEVISRTVDEVLPTIGIWAVWIGNLEDCRGAACMKAFEKRPNFTRVILLNGVWTWTEEPFKPIDPTFLEKFAQMIAGEASERLPHPTIRKRHEEVEKLWRLGLSDSEIAKELFVSESTVKRDRKALGLMAKS